MSAIEDPRASADSTGKLTFLRGEAPSTGMHFDWLQCNRRLSQEDCGRIVDACLSFPLTPSDTVGEDRYPGRRRGDARKIGLNAETGWIFELLCEVAAEGNAAAFGLDLTTINRSPQYVEYKPGRGQFDWHNDYSHDVAESPRKLTLIIQLSAPQEYEGGRLQVFGHEIEELPAERGAVLAFPSLLYHRVTPVTSGRRRALVAWIAGPRIC